MPQFFTLTRPKSKYGAVNFFEDQLFSSFEQLGYQHVQLQNNKVFNYRPGDFYFSSLGSKDCNSVYNMTNKLPIVSWIVDHPLYYYPLDDAPPTHLPIVNDPARAHFIGSYCRNRPPYAAICLPHCGYPCINQDRYIPPSKRDIDVLFSGSLESPDLIIDKIHELHDRKTSELIKTVIQEAMSDRHFPFDLFLMNGLEVNNDKPDTTTLQTFFYWLDKYYRAYYRFETLKALIDAGMVVHIYTDNSSVLSKLQNRRYHLKINPQVSFQSFTELSTRAKIVLNPSYCNGDGFFSERIPTTMLNGAVSISSKGKYAASHFKDNEEILFYDIDKITQLPDIIQKLLQDKNRLDAISSSGQKKAESEHLPIHRAQTITSLVIEFTHKFILGEP